MAIDEEVPEVEVEEAHRKLDQGVPMIDVREPSEYREVRIPGAKLLPLSDFLERFEELPRDGEVMIQCRSGSRSALATKALRERGFRAVNVGGGILAWERAGLPVERGE